MNNRPDVKHYTQGSIQPWDYIEANRLDFFEGNVIKYVTRWRHKDGIRDLEKARDYINELIRQEHMRMLKEKQCKDAERKVWWSQVGEALWKRAAARRAARK